MTARTLAKKRERRRTHAVTLALIAWLFPMQVHGESSDVDAPATAVVESHRDHEHEGGQHAPRDQGTAQRAEPEAAEPPDDHDHDLEQGNVRDHEHDHEESGGFLKRLVSYLGRFHPPVVNFPIAMLIGGALSEILLLITGRVLFANAARYCIWIGAVGALTAGVLGWFFGGFQLSDSRWVMTVHRWLGTTTVAWSILVLFLSERVHRSRNSSKATYRCVLFTGAVLGSVTGFFGGALIYGIDHYVW